MSIKPSDRVGQIKEYYFSRKLREVAALNAAGRDIISLGIGGPDRMPHASVIETLAADAAQPDAHSYQSYTGLPELRRAYADWYRRVYGVTLDPDGGILPLIGSKEGILHISLAFVNPGDSVLVPDPGYPTYTSVSRIVGANIIPYTLDPANGWYPDFEALEQLPLDNVRILWVNYPHMPTGTPATPELFDRFIDFGRRHNILIVNDNPYSLILNDHPLSILSRPGAMDVALELNSLSKSHNMAGWRMGVLCGNPELVGYVLKIKSNIDSGQFRPMMRAAATALSLGDDWNRTLNDVYASRRRVAERIMTALGCTFDPHQTGLFLWGRIPDSCPGSEALADQVLDRARVFITPGFIFGPAGERYIRISLCATEQMLERALERVAAAFTHSEQ